MGVGFKRYVVSENAYFADSYILSGYGAGH